MLKVLNKTVNKIDTFQEECSDLVLALGTLLGENVSIADISVNKTPEKQKKLKEAVVRTSGGDVVEIDARGRKKRLPRAVASEVDKGGKVLSAGDDEEPEDENSTKETKMTPKEKLAAATVDTEKDKKKMKPGQLRGRIMKTEKELEINESLREWVIKYFEARKQGNFAEASVLKRKIEAAIGEKKLDRETVFFRADDIQKKAEEEKESKEKPEEEPEEEPEDKSEE